MKQIFVFLALLGTLFGVTLDEIRQSGVVKIGFYDSNPPFSKQNSDGSYEGFEIKMAQKIAADLFDGKEHTIDFVPLVATDRIPSLQEDRVDFVLYKHGFLTKSGSGCMITILIVITSTLSSFFLLWISIATIVIKW